MGLKTEITETSCSEAQKFKCDNIVDVGFILDSSGSLRGDYQTEKNFLKSLAEAFAISYHGSRQSVVTFGYNTKLSIRFKDHTERAAFNAAVDSIPLMGSSTRIDRALRQAQREMFTKENGARVTSPKVLILLTDGSQSRGQGAENPSDIAAQLRASGVNMIVIGIGSQINKQELDRIAGGKDKAFIAESFDKIKERDFVIQITESTCNTVHQAIKPQKCEEFKNSDAVFAIDMSKLSVGYK